MRQSLLVLALLAAVSSPALAGEARPPAAILKPIQKAIRDEYHPRRLAPSRMFRSLDINSDGVPDWVADFNESGENGWCGTGGCREVIYVSRPGGRFVAAFDAQVREFSLKRKDSVLRLDVDVHGSQCGTFGASACPHSFVWDQAHRRFNEAITPEGVTRVTAALLQNVEQAKPPALAVAGLAEQRRRCVKAGGKPDDDPADSVPDLNGDGLRDWVASAPWCDIPEGKTAPVLETRVYVSGPSGFRQALAFPLPGYAIDIATRPAQLVQLTEGDCGYATICAERIWAWDAKTASFKAIAEHPSRPRPDS